MKVVIAVVFTVICFGVGGWTMMNTDMSDTFAGFSSDSDSTNGTDPASSNSQPAIMVTLAAGDHLISDLKFLGSSIELPGMYQTIMETGLNSALDGMYRTKPAGLFGYFNDDESKPDLMLLLPVIDTDLFVDNLRQLGTIKTSGELITFAPNMVGQAYMMKHIGNYMVVSDSVQTLQQVPSDPESLFGEMAATYLASIKVRFDQIPNAQKSAFKDGFASGAKQALKTAEHINSDDYVRATQQIETYLAECSEMVMGLSIDRTGSKMVVDVNIVGHDGSRLAELNTKNSQLPGSLFAGFQDPAAAINLNICTAILPEQAKDIREMIERMKEEITLFSTDSSNADTENEVLAEFIDELFESMEKTATNKHLDVAITSYMNADQQATLIAGLHLEDTSEMETKLVELLELEKSNNQSEFQITTNIETFNDINFHQAIMTEEAQPDEISFGNPTNLTFGFGKGVVYLVLGDDQSLPLLKQLIERSADQQNQLNSNLNFHMHVKPYAKLANPESAQEQLVQELLNKLGNGDVISASMQTTDGGLNMKYAVELGLVKTIWKTGEMAINGGAPVGPTKTNRQPIKSPEKSHQTIRNNSKRPVPINRPSFNKDAIPKVTTPSGTNLHMIPSQKFSRPPTQKK